jgi:hypothetical protein
MDVAHVRELNAFRHSDPASTTERLRRRRRPIAEAKVGVVGRKVDWHVGAQFFHDPAAEVGQLFVGVVESWNQERRDLKPDRRLMLQVLQGLEYGLQMARAGLVVELFGKAL